MPATLPVVCHHCSKPSIGICAECLAKIDNHPISHANMLKHFVAACKEIKRMAEPSYWAYERRDRAKGYQQIVAELRHYYVALATLSDNPLFILQAAAKVAGAEGGTFRLLALGLQNKLSNKPGNWAVVDRDLVWKNLW